MNKNNLPALIVEILESNGGVSTRREIGRKVRVVVERLCDPADDFNMTYYYDLGWAQTELAKLSTVFTRKVGNKSEWYLV